MTNNFTNGARRNLSSVFNGNNDHQPSDFDPDAGVHTEHDPRPMSFVNQTQAYHANLAFLGPKRQEIIPPPTDFGRPIFPSIHRNFSAAPRNYGLTREPGNNDQIMAVDAYLRRHNVHLTSLCSDIVSTEDFVSAVAAFFSLESPLPDTFTRDMLGVAKLAQLLEYPSYHEFLLIAQFFNDTGIDSTRDTVYMKLLYWLVELFEQHPDSETETDFVLTDESEEKLEDYLREASNPYLRIEEKPDANQAAMEDKFIDEVQRTLENRLVEAQEESETLRKSISEAESQMGQLHADREAAEAKYQQDLQTTEDTLRAIETCESEIKTRQTRIAVLNTETLELSDKLDDAQSIERDLTVDIDAIMVQLIPECERLQLDLDTALSFVVEFPKLLASCDKRELELKNANISLDNGAIQSARNAHLELLAAVKKYNTDLVPEAQLGNSIPTEFSQVSKLPSSEPLLNVLDCQRVQQLWEFKITEASTKLATNAADIERLEKERTQLQADYDKMSEDLVAKTELAGKLENEVDELKRKVVELGATANKRQNIRQKDEAEFNRLQGVANGFNTKIADLRADLAKFAAKKPHQLALQVEVNSLSSDYLAMYNSINHYSDDFDQHTVSYISDQMLQEYTSKIDALALSLGKPQPEAMPTDPAEQDAWIKKKVDGMIAPPQ